MQKISIDIWQSDFLNSTPLFKSLRSVAAPFAGKANWPTLMDLAAEFNARDSAITPVTQGGKPGSLEEKYESRIYRLGELQTREANWHDLFNALVWLQFPKTKTVLNALHYQASLARPEKTNRGPLENVIAGFDESGAIIISRREDLLQMIRNYEWHKLFVDNRAAFGTDIHCLIFGHALFEKALSPYVGMTAQSLLICCDASLHNDVPALDTCVAAIWQQGGVMNTRDLESFPLLGVPGWYAQQDADFYANQKYFRLKPARKFV